MRIRSLASPGLAMILAAALAAPGVVHSMESARVMTGGVGEDDRNILEHQARGYDLKAVFALAGGAYLSDVDVRIRDSAGNVVVDTVTEGPWLYADLEPGEYRVTASKFGETVERRVRVSSAKRTLVSFNDWTQSDSGDEVYPIPVR